MKKGQKHTLETIIKLKNSHLGQRGYWKGRKRPPFSEEWKRKMSESLKGNQRTKGKKYPNRKRTQRHSTETREKISKAFSGKNHPNWKGGITPEDNRIRHSLEYEIWRKEIYQRDNWTCRLCNKKCGRKDIVAHHLKLFSEYPELRFSINNGITLCRSCHFKIHHNNLCQDN